LNKKQMALSLLALAVGIVGAVGMIAARPQVATQRPEAELPLVRVVPAQVEDVRLTVRTQGVVAPRTESDLVPEVSGRVVWISPSLVSGGFFDEGEVLLKIDAREYEMARRSADAAVSRHASELELAIANRKRSRELAGREIVSAATLDESENAARVAEAALREARMALEKAQMDLDRAALHAPFLGRVRDEQVDVGQFVNRGTRVAGLYAVDYAEVRLPIPDYELAFLDLPLAYRGEGDTVSRPAVLLRAEFAGGQHEWKGRIVRTEGEIDPGSRMVHAVAQVEDPYGRSTDSDRPPLAVGLFVEAEIVGHDVKGVVRVPRSAMRSADEVLIVGDAGELEFRRVDVLRTDGETVVVRSGIAPGERICVSPLEAAVAGMRVRVVDEAEGKQTQPNTVAGT
jgi:RND family efflux transporter MFP subunit